MRQKRKGNPEEVCNRKLKKSDVIGAKNQHGIRAIKWMDKRLVLMMTSKSEHFDILVSIGRKNKLNEDVEKPMAVIDYNNAKKELIFLIRCHDTILLLFLEEIHIFRCWQ